MSVDSLFVIMDMAAGPRIPIRDQELDVPDMNDDRGGDPSSS
jgi:hypothetical protein